MSRSGRNPTRGDARAAMLPGAIALLFAAVAVVQAVSFYPRLPDVMATHFAFSGEADGWSSKGSFVLTYGVAEALFLLLGFGIPPLLRRIPSQFVNIPNRREWLSPPHRERTLADLRAWMRWFSAVTLGFLVATGQIIYQINLGEGRPALPELYPVVLVLFIAAVVWLTFLVYRRFGRRPSR